MKTQTILCKLESGEVLPVKKMWQEVPDMPGFYHLPRFETLDGEQLLPVDESMATLRGVHSGRLLHVTNGKKLAPSTPQLRWGNQAFPADE